MIKADNMLGYEKKVQIYDRNDFKFTSLYLALGLEFPETVRHSSMEMTFNILIQNSQSLAKNVLN